MISLRFATVIPHSLDLMRYALLVLIVQSHGGANQRRHYANGHSQPPTNPVVAAGCNEFFTVDHEDYLQKRYDVTLLLKSDVPLRDVQVDIRFDRDVDSLVNYFGTLSSTNKRDFQIVKQSFNMHAGAILKLKLEVNYSTNLMPWLEMIRFNGKTLCPRTQEADRTSTTKDRPTVYRFAPSSWTLNQRPVDSSREFVPIAGYPMLVTNRGVVYPIQNPKTAAPLNVPRNFSSNRETRFNSSCQVMNPNIAISTGRWDGIATLTAEESMESVRIEIVFDTPIYILGNHLGEVRTEDSVHFLIENSSLSLAQDAEIELHLLVKFNENGRIPDVSEINLNDRNVCSQRKRRVSTGTEASSGTLGTGTITTATSSPLVRTSPSPASSERNDDSQCATLSSSASSNIPRIQSRILGGVTAKSGEIPWHVAIFYDDQYQCGGSIISRKGILTAAHCLTVENTNQTLELELFKVYIGIVDLSSVDDYFYHSVSDVLIHSDYNAALHTTDIGVLKLKRDIIFNNFIKPVCLYPNTTDISSFFNRYGKVAGWGLTRNGLVSNALNYLDMPVVSQKKCSQTNVQFYTVLAYGESFCAGHADGNSVCNGDSGGGLVFEDSNRYFLRGIVSISATKRNQLMCDPNRYSVFTDVSKFLRWIRSNMD